jgi:diaminopimelate epimerase
MPVKFTKMHGLGNDYVYISTFDQTVADPVTLARAVSDRHRGVGGDGLILIAPADRDYVGGAWGRARSGLEADVRMIMFNADGSRAQMCGNGIRCVAKYAYERGLARRNPLRVATDRGVLELELTLDADGRVELVRVDMGEPILDPKRIPVSLPGARVVSAPIEWPEEERVPGSRFRVQGEGTEARRHEGTEGIDHPSLITHPSLRLTAVSMGNPHAVFFVPDVSEVPLATWGPPLERHALFPERINVHFVQVVRPDYVKMITWERGTGATQACGTGASAVCVAGALNDLTSRRITARLPGGELQLQWDERTNHVFKTGPATEVFSGVWPD